ncbi:MAG: metallophosphoesterase [Victivallales bacterium]|nr:metallophosphoesterase [Victivallales bacterium]
MTRIAAISDLHLPDRSDTIKDIVFDWALAELAQLHVDLLVAVGDLTSLGTQISAQRFRNKLAQLHIPVVITPGNAELRTPSQTQAVLEILRNKTPFPGVIPLDTSRHHLTDEDRDTLLQLLQNPPDTPLFAITHCPPDNITQTDAALINQCLAAGILNPLLTGHIHEKIDDGPRQTIHGLDPDKATGAPAGFTIFDNASGTWQRTEHPCPMDDPHSWTSQERTEVYSRMGISTMDAPFDNIAAATAERLPVLEIVYHPGMSPEAFAGPLAEWRAAGGRFLAVQLPHLTGESHEEAAAGVHFAVQCHASLVSLAAPWYCSAERLASASNRQQVAQTYEQILRPAADARMLIGIENLHLRYKDPFDNSRGYGCTPFECREWIVQLRNQMRYGNIGCSFDIGNARNNRRLASRYNLCEWYAELGPFLVACHLHQVQESSGRPVNHYPVTSLYQPFVELGGFLMAWHLRQIQHAPLIFTIKTEPPIQSLRNFKNLLENRPEHQ